MLATDTSHLTHGARAFATIIAVARLRQKEVQADLYQARVDQLKDPKVCPWMECLMYYRVHICHRVMQTVLIVYGCYHCNRDAKTVYSVLLLYFFLCVQQRALFRWKMAITKVQLKIQRDKARNQRLEKARARLQGRNTKPMAF